MRRYAVGDSKSEDSVGQLLPGSFDEPAALLQYFDANERYSSLLSLSEWKCMGAPDFSNLSKIAKQKLLVRRDGANWEELFINMELIPSEVVGKRWVITSIYKQGSA